MDKNILYTLKTKENASILLDFVEFLSKKTHKTGAFSIDKFIIEFFGEKDIPKWVDSIRSSDTGLGGAIDVGSVRAFLEGIEGMVRNADVVKMDIPFRPSENFISKVYDILVNSKTLASLGKESTGFLLDVSVIKSSEGDTKLFVRGNVLDLGMKKIVKNYLMSKDVINRYL